jgi:anti-anti-sigma factor
VVLMPSLDVSPRIEDLDLHDHVCWVYASEEEHRAVLASYLTAGLARDERVVFFGAPTVADYLSEAGVPVDELAEGGQLVLAPAEEEYLVDGRFDPDERLRGYAAAVQVALDEGFTGLRVAAETSWLLGCPTAQRVWPGYEFRADLLAVELPLTGLCAYDARHWPPEDLALLKSLHSLTVPARPGDVDTGFRLYGQRDGSIRLRGELDFVYAGQVRELLKAGAAESLAPVLDVTGLTFVDVAGMRAIGLTCQEMARKRRQATIRGASSLFRRVWQAAGFDRIDPAIVLDN